MNGKKIREIGKMKLKLCLIIINSNEEVDIFIYIKEFLRITDRQLYLYLDYLIDRKFILMNKETAKIELSNDGIQYLKDSNLYNIKIRELVNNKPFDFDYANKLKNFVPNDVQFRRE